MADSRADQLAALAGANVAADDSFVVYDLSAGDTLKMTPAAVAAALVILGDLVTQTTVDDLAAVYAALAHTHSQYALGGFATATDAGNTTLVVADGAIQRRLMTADLIYTLPALGNDPFVLILVQDGTGGRDATFAAAGGTSLAWQTPSGAAPPQVTSAAGYSVYTFIPDVTGTRWLGYGAANVASGIAADSTTLVGTGTDVQAVLEELDNGIADHLADTADAHDASAISYVGGSGMAATDVEGAIDELAGEKVGAGADIPRTHQFLGASGAAFPTANTCIWVRMRGRGTISKIGLQVAVASGNMSVAVYSNSGTGRAAVPGTRLATSGAVAVPTAGYAEVSLGASIAVEDGDWFAISCDNTTASFARNAGAGAVSDFGLGLLYGKATSHPAPASNPTSLVARTGPDYCMVGVA